jgi:hypothetical protein
MAADLAGFRAQRQTLLDLLKQTQPLLQSLGMQVWLDNLKQLTTRVLSDHFKVIILGEFKRGKSTFINAMLGQEVLPAFATPCTAVINEVHWGERQRAILVFRNPPPSPLPASLPSAVQEHVRRAGNGRVPPLEVPVQELEQYVVIADPARDQAQSVAETPYDHVKLYWPIELCKNGVEIIDSPGLNEHGTRTRVTINYLSQVDAVVFVLSCQALASRSEMDVIEQNVRGAGHESIFFVCNRFDEVRERERARLVQFGRDKLGGKTGLGPDGVYFLSALEALEGRLDGDAARVERSGFAPFEKALSRFLVQERGKVKLLQPARELTRAVRLALHEVIPGQRRMLEENLGQLQKRYEEKKPLLDDAERRRTQILERARIHCERLREEVRGEVERRLWELASRMPEWAKELKPQNTIQFIKFEGAVPQGFKAQASRLVEEVVQALSGRMEQEQSVWTREKLLPLIQGRLTELSQEINSPIEALLADLDHMKADLSGLQAEPALAEERRIGGLERVLAAAGGFLVGGAGSALLGATLGYKEMLKSLGPQIAIGVGMILLVGFNPLLIIPVLLAASIVQGFWTSRSTTDKMKMKVAEAMANKVKARAKEGARERAEQVYRQAETVAQTLDSGMAKEIQSVREQIETVLAAKQAGEASVQAQQKALAEAEGRLQQIDTDLCDMILTVAGVPAK